MPEHSFELFHKTKGNYIKTTFSYLYGIARPTMLGYVCLPKQIDLLNEP